MVFTIIGAFYDVIHPGTLLMFLTGVLFIFCAVWDGRLKNKKISTLIYWLSVAWMLFVSVFIVVNYVGGLTHLPENENDVTVIVLGARIKNGLVNTVQKRRLDKAIVYLEENLEAKCIVTGGLQKDENLVVGDIMKDYLVAQGIDEHRISVEGMAQDTYENLLYSKDIIETEGMPQNIVIVSDNFHLLRATWFAKSIGYENVYRLATSTPKGILPSYWFREILSMMKGFIITTFPRLFGH